MLADSKVFTWLDPKSTRNRWTGIPAGYLCVVKNVTATAGDRDAVPAIDRDQ